MFVGNTSKPHEELVRTAHLFADLPPAMVDPAFLDRLHYYLPGWEAPKLERRLFTDHFGFVSDYFADRQRAHAGHALMMGVTMMASTRHGGVPTFGEAAGWLRAAGFEAVRLIEPIGFQYAFVARKPPEDFS